jgi:hypothetical protein
MLTSEQILVSQGVENLQLKYSGLDGMTLTVRIKGPSEKSEKSNVDTWTITPPLHNSVS